MSITKCVLTLKALLVCGTSLLAIFLLSGCSHMMHKFGYEPIPLVISKECQETKILMTDLTVLQDQRQYMLPDGRLCPSHQAGNRVRINDDNNQEESHNDENNKKNKNNEKDK